MLGYSPEYASLEDNPALLATLAEATGGRVLDFGDVAAVFTHNLSATPAARPIWPWLALAATLLLPLDVAARRLTVTRGDWAGLWRRVRNYESGIRNEETGGEPERAEGMAQLLRAKERAGEITNYELRMTNEEATADGRPMTDNEVAPVIRAPIDDEASGSGQSSGDDTLAARLRKRRNM